MHGRPEKKRGVGLTRPHFKQRDNARLTISLTVTSANSHPLYCGKAICIFTSPFGADAAISNARTLSSNSNVRDQRLHVDRIGRQHGNAARKNMRIAEDMLDARFAHHRFADVIGELNMRRSSTGLEHAAS
ncbi:hypothetical protein NKI47_28765 [Mesorhizobium sp. M0633]